MDKDFDNILEYVGSCGRFQKRLFFIILVPSSVFSSLALSLLYFGTVVPDHWCKVPGRDPDAYSIQEWRSLTIPKSSDDSYEKCLQFATTWNEESGVFFILNKTVECVEEWEHDRSVWSETIGTARIYLCKKSHYNLLFMYAYVGGCGVGALVLHFMADALVGRKFIFYICLGLHLIFNLLLLVPVMVYEVHLIVRFLAGMCFPAIFQMPFITTMEVVNRDHRSLVAVISLTSWTVGLCLASLVAFLIPHWWYLILIATIPVFFFFFLWNYIDQSPRWLLSKRSTDSSSLQMMKIAECNNNDNYVQLETLRKNLDKLGGLETRKVKLLVLIKHRRICSNFVCMFLISCFCFFAYGCVFFKLSMIADSPFLDFFSTVAIDLPAWFIGWISVNYGGRRLTSVICNLLAGILCLFAMIFINNQMVVISLTAITKLFVAGSIFVLHLMTGEVFPTILRATGTGVVTTGAVLGMICSSYISQIISDIWIFTFVALVNVASLLISILLPETLGLNLPQTLLDSEDLGRNRPFYTFIHFWNLDDWVKVNFGIRSS